VRRETHGGDSGSLDGHVFARGSAWCRPIAGGLGCGRADLGRRADEEPVHVWAFAECWSIGLVRGADGWADAPGRVRCAEVRG
jgi:hypothetical protein